MKKPTLKVGDTVYDALHMTAKVVKIERGWVMLDANPNLPLPAYAIVWMPPAGWVFAGLS
jgi:hypothetical protein